MSLSNLIRERRSIRKYNSLPISQDLVMNLLKKAEYLCPYEGEARWRYIYAGSPEAGDRLAHYMFEKLKENKVVKLLPAKLIETFRKKLSELPANIIVIAETDPNPSKSDEIYGTVSRIIQNFQLLAWEEKLGMVWDSATIIQNELFFNRIGIRQGERYVGMLHLGYFDKIPKGKARTSAERKWTEF